MKYFVYCRKSSESDDRQALSIDSQYEQILSAHLPSAMEIAGVYREAMSAKEPGRPLFNEMLTRIRRGEAQGIVAWHPDRLARNSVDGGTLIYLLDRKLLLDLKFSTFGFENNSQGKFMLSILFGYSKYYVDSLSENVKRGNRTKLERGWLPGMAPLGYLNDKATNTITKDPVRFPIVRLLFEHMLTGAYSPRQLHTMACTQWGLRTVRRRKSGDKPMALSAMYRLLSHPFYAGTIRYGGKEYPGKHPPMVTQAEFDAVQAMLHRRNRPRRKRHDFAYTGMIRCGSCGLSVTAEHTVNRFGSRYTYYHCTWRKEPRCHERSIRVEALETQLASFLSSIELPPEATASIEAERQRRTLEKQQSHDAVLTSLQSSVAATRGELDELLHLRLRLLLDDSEFTSRRTLLQEQLANLEQQLTGSLMVAQETPATSVENLIATFAGGDHQAKRLVIAQVTQNMTLRNRQLSIKPRTPFVVRSEMAAHP